MPDIIIFTPIFTPTLRRETPLHPSTCSSHGEPWDVELYSYTSARDVCIPLHPTSAIAATSVYGLRPKVGSLESICAQVFDTAYDNAGSRKKLDSNLKS